MYIFGLPFLCLISLKSLAVALLCLRFSPHQPQKCLTQKLHIYLFTVPKCLGTIKIKMKNSLFVRKLKTSLVCSASVFLILISLLINHLNRAISIFAFSR